MKRSFLFTILLLCVGAVLAQDRVKTITRDGLWYNLYLDRNVAVVIESPYPNIKFKNEASTKKVVVPEVVYDELVREKPAYWVIGIDAGAFREHDKITEVELPESIVFIDNIAFAGCSRLKNITLPSDLSYIGNGAFVACKSLQSIVIPDSLQLIGSGAFDGCTNLKSVEWNAIHCSLESLGYDSVSSDTTYIPPFIRCSKLSGFTFGEKVEYITPYLLYYNQLITEITIPKSVTEIGDYAFANCEKLKLARFNTSLGARARRENWFAGSPTDIEAVLMPGESVIINTEVAPGTN